MATCQASRFTEATCPAGQRTTWVHLMVILNGHHLVINWASKIFYSAAQGWPNHCELHKRSYVLVLYAFVVLLLRYALTGGD
ncbi:hypothetical protein TNIN_248871 [Trichonephila inaurata madagascariensis]|uniref:Uncharacterized protein n=1 Tax=Trichonephila inaurata madagascariensis TaxID=2747483 RepID=A0A8X6XSG7_9ARAC|nr:hypothetical protein TNIN_248871 [Trichonephila inaurata madagascariensis]